MHPQWLISVGEEKRQLTSSLQAFHGRVLDIGCSDRRLAALLPEGSDYVGVDYPDTATGLYDTRPDIFADAGALPFPDGAFDAVILKDVLEHVRHPDRALSEAARVLRDGGRLLLWIPFLYPIHDAPHDFQRFTEHGLRARLQDRGLKIAGHIAPVLRSIETAGLLSCLAIADAGQQIVAHRRRYIPLLPVLALMIVVINLGAWCMAWLPSTRFMPAFYRLTAIKLPLVDLEAVR